jgi:hypothetical protein
LPLLSSATTKWDPYTDFYNFLNYGLFNDGGDCYGFSTTAVLYFEHYELGDQTMPYYPISTASVAAMPGQTGKYCLPLIGCLAASDTLYQSTFPIYIHQVYGGDQLPANWNDPSSEQAQAQLLMSSLQGGTPVVLALGPTEGHAVVAYGYEEFSNNSLTINISDPNYGNTPRYASYDNGQFLYSGTYTWTTFSVVSPEILQWGWISPSQLSGTITSTNSYYDYVFSSAPITIVGQSGQAFFITPGDSLSFSTSISGVVGFEEGSIQAYGIPEGVPFTIEDPGATSSMVTVILPQNGTSLVGYQLTSTSSTPLSVLIAPSSDSLNVTTSNAMSLSVSAFSVAEGSRSIVNASSIPMASSQTAVLTVSNWSNLNSTSSAANLQVFNPTSTVAVASYTLVNAQQSLPAKSNVSTLLSVAVIISAAVVVSVLLYVRQRRTRRHNEASA